MQAPATDWDSPEVNSMRQRLGEFARCPRAVRPIPPRPDPPPRLFQIGPGVGREKKGCAWPRFAVVPPLCFARSLSASIAACV